jgi:hypothetical protein
MRTLRGYVRGIVEIDTSSWSKISRMMCSLICSVVSSHEQVDGSCGKNLSLTELGWSRYLVAMGRHLDKREICNAEGLDVVNDL